MTRGRTLDENIGAVAGAKAKRRPVAVALDGSTDPGRAPRVVATGRGAVAEQILALAFANDVKVREDADLAEILGLVDVDSEIPLEALAAVAEILAYVYRANGRDPAQSAPPPTGALP
jgi:flagellar biosynthesis protein